MQDLIERLQAATEGSRELDAAIALSIDGPRLFFESKGLPFDEDSISDPECFPDRDSWAGHGYLYEAPHYTTSIDAALTLVPEGWKNKTIGIHDEWAEAILGLPGQSEAYGRSATPALALCAAALRARMQTGLTELTEIAQETDNLR